MKRKILLLIMFLFLSINVYAVGEATIKDLKVNGVACKCIDYECSVEVDATMATITYDLVDTEATVDRLSGFKVELLSQITTVKLVVSNTLEEQKVENTYNITINKHEKSNDKTLKSLKVNDKVIELLEEVVVYSYVSDYKDEKIVINAVTNDSHAKIIKEKEYDFPLDMSSSAIDFTVEAENKERQEYRIVVTRGIKPDTTLKSLKLDHGEISFDPKVTEYEVMVDYSVTELKVEAIPNSDKAKVEIKKSLLVVGENKITIIVTNDKTTTEYTLLVTREENLDKSLANLKSLKIDEYPKLDFEENVLDYKLNFSKIPEKLTIHAIAKEENSKVTILNNEDLKDGSKVTIRIKLNESTVSREYTLEINEQKGISNNKTFILISLIGVGLMIMIMLILEINDHKKEKRRAINKLFELRRKKEKKKKEEKEKKKESKPADDLEII